MKRLKMSKDHPSVSSNLDMLFSADGDLQKVELITDHAPGLTQRDDICTDINGGDRMIRDS